jgi:hypothetical protein
MAEEAKRGSGVLQRLVRWFVFVALRGWSSTTSERNEHSSHTTQGSARWVSAAGLPHRLRACPRTRCTDRCKYPDEKPPADLG